MDQELDFGGPSTSLYRPFHVRRFLIQSLAKGNIIVREQWPPRLPLDSPFYVVGFCGLKGVKEFEEWL